MEYGTDLLSDLIDRKHQCLVELRDMGKRQYSLVNEGSITGLLDLLSAKQDVIARLQSVERALDPFRGQDPETRRWRSPESRRRCADQVKRCELLLAEILAQEKRSEQELVRRRDEAAEQLQGIHRAGQARGAYTSPAVSQPHELDLCSDA
ncbi:MAG: hypothetical protein HUU20_08050 [Pirellulales bacterium]|nr:hypothetical protein [Pirellulales bacterium]